MPLRGENVVLRPLSPETAARLAEIRAEPGVVRWWGPPHEPDTDPHGSATLLAVEANGELIGLIQFEEEDEPDYRHAGIDIFLAEQAQGHGHGPDAVRTLARYLIEERGHHRLTIDPATENAAAVRAYEKVGFRRVG